MMMKEKGIQRMKKEKGTDDDEGEGNTENEEGERKPEERGRKKYRGLKHIEGKVIQRTRERLERKTEYIRR